MAYQQYKFSFYLNARHAIYINGRLGEHHPHTWQISLYVIKVTQGFVMFNQVEKAVEEFMSQFQDHDLNETALFENINPTLENISELLFDKIQEILNELGWLAYTIEVSETPTRSYIISMGERNVEGLDEEEASINRILEESFL